MPERRSLGPLLRQLDQTLGERGMPPGARARIEDRLARHARRRAAISGFKLRWLPAFTFAAGAALVLAVVGLRLSSSEPIELRPEARELMGMFTVHGQSCHDRQEVADTVLEGTCRLVSSAMELHTWEPVRLRNDDGTVRLSDGTAVFDIRPVEAGQPPTRIHVSHGTIEVLGTRFTIEQRARGGHVDLFEGRIRFVGLDGSSTEIAPGQRYTWGETVAALTLTPPPVAAPSSASNEVARGSDSASPTQEQPSRDDEPDEPDEPDESDESGELDRPNASRESGVPHRGSRAARRASRHRSEAKPATEQRPAGSADEAALIIEQVARLRAQKRYTEAVDVLRRAENARTWDRRTAQVLSYERGEILERHLSQGDPSAACAHWARHQARFGEGRYARAVTAAQERLGCE